jgi:peroxiredoxin
VLRAVREMRMADAEKAEAQGRKEKQPEEKIAQLMAEALRANADKVRAVESALAEARGYEQFARAKYDESWRLLEEANDVPKERLARLRLLAGDQEKAEQLAREAMENGTNQVHLLANYADILYQAGKKEQAIEQFQKLRTLGSEADLEVPVFARLGTLASELNLGPDWRQPTVVAKDVGIRPRLENLGPFRWQPPSAPDWRLPDGKGGEQALQDYRGKPLVLIFYLGHGCGHCIEQLNIFEPMIAQFSAEGISLVGVSTDSVEGLGKTLEKSKLPAEFPLVSDQELRIFKAYRAFDDFENFPLHGTFLIDGAGLVRWQDISYEPFKEPKFLLEESKRLLRQAERRVLAAGGG